MAQIKNTMRRLAFIALLSSLMIFSHVPKVVAEACSNTSNYGVVSLDIPTLPTRGSYVLWTRMQAPDAEHNRYRLEVNSNTCYEVGGSSIVPGEWEWVSFYGGSLSKTVRYNFDHTTENSLRLIGMDAGVRVDRILLIKNDCVPTGLGDNCQSTTATAAYSSSGATEVPPPSTAPVGGVVIPSQTIVNKKSSISKVVYFADGAPIPTSSNNGIDTTLLRNGSHRISIQITQTNGIVVNEVTTIAVENKQGVLSPFTRWARLNEGQAMSISIALGVVLVMSSVLLFVRHKHLQKRLLTFRGF